MIVPTDDDYRATKRLKQGQARLEPPFDELVSWIHHVWGVRPLNVICESVNDRRPRSRLNVVLEFEKEVARFRSGLNFDRDKQDAIGARFREVAGATSHSVDLTNLFVIFSAFAPVAIIEANERVSKEEIGSLEQRLADPALWCIHRVFSAVTFMFYTDLQLAERMSDGSKQAYCQAYFEMLKPHDEFGYLNSGDYTVAFDSKEKFDRVYGGSWFYYDR